jgi:hypothetical protein
MTDVIVPTEAHWAYFLGLFATDGSHSGSITGKGRVSIELQKQDAPVLEVLHTVLPMASSVRFRTRTTNFSTVAESASLNIHGRAFRQELAGWGYPPGPKSATVGPPTWEFL